jgi:predicted dehydrogenase
MDIIPERARLLGEELGVPWTVDLEEAVGAAEAFSIATPTVTHAEVGCACLERGRAVLMEKPLAADCAGGETLVRLAAVRGALLAVGHVERFNPAFRAAEAAIGVPRFVESHRLSTFVPRSLDVDVVLDLMIHDLDLTLRLMTSPLESCDAVGVPVLTAGEDIANARLRFQDGAVANLTASRVSRERVRKIRFFSAHRYLSLDLMERRVEQVVLEPAGADAPASLALKPEEAALAEFLRARGLNHRHGQVPVPETNPLEDELRDFLGGIEGRPLFGATGEQGLRNLEVALEIHRKVQESLRRLGLDGTVTGS